MNMTKQITFGCLHCQSLQTISLNDSLAETLNFNCPSCETPIELKRLLQNNIEGCSVCGCKDLHQHKDFNKALGLTLFIIGALLAPWTYYISLFVALIIDAALYPFFPWMAVCYKCHAEFRGWPKNPNLDRFNHEIGAHYEYREEAKANKS